MDFIYLYQLAKPSLCTAPVALKPAEVLQPAIETRLSHTHLLPGTVSTDYVSKFELNNPRRTNEVRPESQHCSLLYSLFMQRLTTKYLQVALGEKVIKASGIEAFTPQVSR